MSLPRLKLLVLVLLTAGFFALTAGQPARRVEGAQPVPVNPAAGTATAPAKITPAGPVLARDSQRLLRGHRGPVNSVAISPDGKTVASAGNDPTIHLWDRATGKPLNRLVGHPGGV